MDERQKKLDKLARDVLLLSRNTLLVNLRFLDMALSRLELVAGAQGGAAYRWQVYSL